MKFKKIYIEITNSCNFSCSFCFKTERPLRFMTPAEFATVLAKIKPFTNYIYLHVLGEPLLHPKLDEILVLARQAGIYVNITTNGALLLRKQELLLQYPVRQINISLHDAEENIADANLDTYLNSTLQFASKAAAETYINLRLWNGGVKSSSAFNRICMEKISTYFDLKPDLLVKDEKDSGIKLDDHVFLQTAPRFEWPDGEEQRGGNQKTCYALRDHVAILVDGTVVPCCLDADGAMALGNVFESDFGGIINAERAQKIRNGFMNNKITEEHCKSCGFFI